MKRIILLVLLTIAFIPVWAQATGKVTDKSDGLGVPYANIYLKDIKMNVSCDAEGNFTLPKNPGKKMIISSVGYEAYYRHPCGFLFRGHPEVAGNWSSGGYR